MGQLMDDLDLINSVEQVEVMVFFFFFFFFFNYAIILFTPKQSSHEVYRVQTILYR